MKYKNGMFQIMETFHFFMPEYRLSYIGKRLTGKGVFGKTIAGGALFGGKSNILAFFG